MKQSRNCSTKCEGGITQIVREFYERHPYPPAEEDLNAYRDHSRDTARREAETFMVWPGEPFRDDRRILVAGCGTSQSARYAMRWPNAKVTGIDVSATSIKETKRLRALHNLDNLQLRQLPVEQAADLAGEFDLIVSTGVLHHLPDPPAGLRALRGVLAPGGAMQIMLYAPYGRTGVYMIQEYCRMLGIGTTRKAILDLANTLSNLPPDHPLVPLLRDAPDFKTSAGLADALLHPQDRAYTVPQLIEFTRNAGLRFGRWIRQAPYLAECGMPVFTPHSRALAALPLEQQFAALELLRGTMLRHTAILYRDDECRDMQPIEFNKLDWPNYVPHRLPDTTCVEQTTSEEVVAVLINTHHTYHDLYLPINAGEQNMFNKIDGKNTIAEIMGPNAQPEVTQAFFRKLWQYDQIVFATSNAGIDLEGVVVTGGSANAA